MNEDMQRRHSSENVKRILARAAELEAQRPDAGITQADLIEIANEVGIDPAALLRAIAEVESEQVAKHKETPSISWREWTRAVVTPSISALFGAVVGASTGLVRSAIESNGVHFETLAGTLIIGAAALGLGLTANGRLRHLVFQASSLGLWMGFTIGFGSTYPVLASDAGGVGLACAVVSGAIGAAVVWFRNRKGDMTPPSQRKYRGHGFAQ